MKIQRQNETCAENNGQHSHKTYAHVVNDIRKILRMFGRQFYELTFSDHM